MRPARLLLVGSKANRVVFRNASRSFPPEVIYERDGDSLRATLAGVQGGQEAQMGFDLKRVAPW